ncbi:hypothetical protein FD755_009462 [Muntiacus reevesi]|uniref:WW domain binding protein VOPP1 n=1 Tax=Muntiacus reevesi TaxID=9886 RepID=A0A5N3XVJ5_MUNRE|nr:hypothetical protein FD755_009462 [Muntiacus reevesi]
MLSNLLAVLQLPTCDAPLWFHAGLCSSSYGASAEGNHCDSAHGDVCRPYEDCCGSRCCVRALSIQRLWYFWFLLMMGVLFCCGAGFFIRRRMYPPPLIEEPAFNVSYTRQPQNPTPEYWSQFPCLSPGTLPDPGIEPGSPALQADSLLPEPPGKPVNHVTK